MLPALIRYLMLMTALLLPSCDAVDVPAPCRDAADAQALKHAEAAVAQAEVALVRARMMGPWSHTRNPRPPEFEPDPAAAHAIATLRFARFKLAQAAARCGGGSG